MNKHQIDFTVAKKAGMTRTCSQCHGTGFVDVCTRAECNLRLKECKEKHPQEVITHLCEDTKKREGCKGTGIQIIGIEVGHQPDDEFHPRNAPLRVSILSALAHRECLHNPRVTQKQAERALKAVFNLT